MKQEEDERMYSIKEERIIFLKKKKKERGVTSLGVDALGTVPGR